MVSKGAIAKKTESVGKRPLRVAHLADVHLGYRKYHRLTKSGFNQREVDINLAFRETIDRLIALRPDVIIIAGDLFHAVRPSNAVVTFCFRELKRLRAKISAPVVIIAGNHEAPKRSDTGSVLRILGEIDGCFVADAAIEHFEFPELETNIVALPHGAVADLAEQAVRANDRFTYNLLVLHGQLDAQWISDFGGAPVSLQRLSPHEWDYIALGHVHVYRPVALNGAYSGAIEHTAVNFWAEAKEPKGFLEVVLPEGKRKIHALTSPREVVVCRSIDALGLESEEIMARIAASVADVSGGLLGKLVRLEISNISRSMVRKLEHRELRRLRALALNFTIDFKPPATVEAVAVAGTGTLARHAPLQAELERYLAASSERSEKAVPTAQISELLQLYFERMEREDEAQKSSA